MPQAGSSPAPVSARRLALAVEPLTRANFAPYGEVIDTAGDGPHRTINAGFAERFDGLARLDTGRQGGQPALSLFRALPRQFPLRLSLVERHLLGSQTFMPLAAQPFLVVVADRKSTRLNSSH